MSQEVGEENGVGGEVQRSSSVAMPPYPARFYAAAQYAAVPGTVDVDPEAEHAEGFSDLTSLMLYSLFQQAAYGPCTTQKPWGWNVVESAKWASWKELGNMAPVEAMRLFVRTLEEEDPNWWQRAKSYGGINVDSGADDGEEGPEELDDEVAAAKGALPKYDPTQEKAILFSEELSRLGGNVWKFPTTYGRKPSPRYKHAAAVVGRKLFVVGGNGNGRYLSDVQALDLTTLTWGRIDVVENSGALPPCAGHSLIVRDRNTLLVVAGHMKDSNTNVTVRVFNIEKCSFSILKTTGQVPSSRGGQTVNLIGNKLWMFGGEDSKRKLLDDLYMLDLDTAVWTAVTAKGTVPLARSDHSAAVTSKQQLVIFGGGSHSSCFNDVHVLDTETLEWTQPAVEGANPGARAGHASCVVGSQWFIVGGGDNKGGVADTVVLDLEDWKWVVASHVPIKSSIASEGLTLVRAGGVNEQLLLTFGGYNGRYSSETAAFRPVLTEQGKIIPGPSPEEDAPSPIVRPASSDKIKVPSDPRNGTASKEGPKEISAMQPAQALPPAHQLARELGDPDVVRQLEDAEAAAARTEHIALNARAEAEFVAAKAKADAWAAIGKMKKEQDELREQLNQALKAKTVAEEDTHEAQALALTAQVQANGAITEAGRLRRELAEARETLAEAQLRVTKVQENSELVQLQKDYTAAKASLADAEQELLSLRGALAGEQARCFRLEVEVAELRQRLQGLAAMEKELELLRRQKDAADEAAAASGGSSGVWGWLGSK